MKLLANKFLIFIVFLFLGLFLYPQDAYAINPSIHGSVRHGVTGAPMRNVWVKLVTSGCSVCTCAQLSPPAVRYTQTDNSGDYTFTPSYSWRGGYRISDVNRPIDTNFDGTDDAVVLEDLSNPECIDAFGGVKVYAGDFGCGAVPNEISVVKPIYLNGSFSQTVLTFQNAQADYTVDVEDIIYTPNSVTNTPTLTPTPQPSCSFNNLPASIDLSVDSTYLLIPGIQQSGSPVTEVTFEVGDSSIAAVCASGQCSAGQSNYTDNSPSFSTNINGFQTTSTTLTITGKMANGQSCTPVSNLAVQVSNTNPWCQFSGIDVVTNGDLVCRIPSTCASSPSCTDNLIATSPGVAIAGGLIDVGYAQISDTNWRADSNYMGQAYTYNYFANKARDVMFAQLPTSNITSVSDLLIGESDGYYWVRYDGTVPLEINADLDFGSNKVVLFIPNAELHINGSVNMNNGTGFFVTLVRENILVSPSVGGQFEATPLPDMEGIYFTNKQFRTGTFGSDLDSQLHIRGSIAAFDRVVMERSLPNNATGPAEFFEFAPDQIMLYPNAIGEQNVAWREVAP